jgi:3-hydroxyisobutyrate dehydrogenase
VVNITSTIAETVRDADIIFICVSDVEDVKSVIFAEGNIAQNAKPNALIVDFSTIGPTAAQEIATSLKTYNLRFLDAPVSGGDIGAQKGILTIMVGGNKTDFEECFPLLQTMGKTIIHCGSVGSGQGVKLCNQVLASLNMIGLCEAIQLAQSLGIDPNLMIEVCSSGAAGSWALSNLAPKIAAADLAPGFMIKHILKDLRLVQESLGNTNLPGVKLADQLFKQVQNLGGAEQGTQAMIRAYRET